MIPAKSITTRTMTGLKKDGLKNLLETNNNEQVHLYNFVGDVHDVGTKENEDEKTVYFLKGDFVSVTADGSTQRTSSIFYPPGHYAKDYYMAFKEEQEKAEFPESFTMRISGNVYIFESEKSQSGYGYLIANDSKETIQKRRELLNILDPERLLESKSESFHNDTI